MGGACRESDNVRTVPPSQLDSPFTPVLGFVSPDPFSVCPLDQEGRHLSLREEGGRARGDVYLSSPVLA